MDNKTYFDYLLGKINERSAYLTVVHIFPIFPFLWFLRCYALWSNGAGERSSCQGTLSTFCAAVSVFVVLALCALLALPALCCRCVFCSVSVCFVLSWYVFLASLWFVLFRSLFCCLPIFFFYLGLLFSRWLYFVIVSFELSNCVLASLCAACSLAVVCVTVVDMSKLCSANREDNQIMMFF
eukprot:GHVQ01024355.1.p1 GENE.GHVQ01024355.1~~GHVQ01024355.1.p1  ORF type:complete len:182 (-),score=9.12 GHVQ01024355.1:1185-1730(-)